MMEKFEFIWYGYFGKLSLPKHRITLDLLDDAPICTAPYHTRPRQRVSEKKDVDQMMKAKVAGLAIIEWALPTVPVHKRKWKP